MSKIMPLTITRNAAVCDAAVWPASDAIVGTLDRGDEVEYRGHVVGGMVKVKTKDGRLVIVHPQATNIDGE